MALGDELRPGLPGSSRVDALDLGQEHQQPGLNEHGDLGGERVVVAEGDLVGRGRVVLVDHRHRVEGEQRLDRVARVDIGAAVGDVAGRQEDLGGVEAFRGKSALPRLLETGLAERRRGLEPGDVAGAARETEVGEAERDCARRDHADRCTGPDDRGDLACPPPQDTRPRSSALARGEARPELDDDRAAGH